MGRKSGPVKTSAGIVNVAPNGIATLDVANNPQLATAKRVRELLGGVSEMHLWRLMCHEAYRHLKFPAPIKINNRNYFRLGEVAAWIDAQAARSRAAA
jgi:predicted DNA-binding transcriptional regulator AlpA